MNCCPFFSFNRIIIFKQESEFEEMDSTVELERGQNIFEIHIDKVNFIEISVFLFFLVFRWKGVKILRGAGMAQW